MTVTIDPFAFSLVAILAFLFAVAIWDRRRVQAMRRRRRTPDTDDPLILAALAALGFWDPEPDVVDVTTPPKEGTSNNGKPTEEERRPDGPDLDA